MRARLRLLAVLLPASLVVGGAGPAATAPSPRPEQRPETPSVRTADHLAALEDRVASLRVAAASRSQQLAAERVWPAPGAHTGWWGERRGGRGHAGIDIDGDSGDPIVAIGMGVVTHAGPAPAGYGGYGLMVVIDHGGFSSVYAHLDRVDVLAGQGVLARTGIGVMGTTGSVTGSHLHFEIRVGGVPVDPRPVMAGATR